MVAEDANRQVFHGRNLDWNLPPEVSMPVADVSLLCRPCVGPGRDEQASANAVLSFFTPRRLSPPSAPFLQMRQFILDIEFQKGGVTQYIGTMLG